MPCFYLCLAFIYALAGPAFSVINDDAPADSPNPLPPTYVKGRLLVKLGHKVSPIVLNDIAQAVGAKKIYSYSSVEGLHLYQFDENISVEDVRQDFLNNSAVLYAEPDFHYKAHVIEDPEYSKQWALENSGQNSGVVDADINAEAAWSIEIGKKTVVVGVIDTGIDYTHPDLVNSMWQNANEIPGNNKDDDQNGYVDDIHGINVIANNGNPLDDNKHGTHVSGTIAATNNNIGVRGVAPNVVLVGCKFLSAGGSGSVSDAIKCMDYFTALKSRAINPVNIVATNNSWGGGAASEAMLDAIKTHERLGILFIAAAGNSADNNDVVDSYPSNYKVANVVAVAATDNKDQLATFSSYGRKTVHVAAPGVKILSTVLRHGYAELSGTSMATPHVAGLAALLASHYPNYDYVRIKNLIMTGGQSINATKNTTISGKRIRAADTGGVGSLTCVNQMLKSRILPASASSRVALGADILLSANAINCAEAPPVLILYNNGGVQVILNDNGENGDAKANDGVYSLRWKPPAIGNYALDFGRDDVVNVQVYDERSSLSYYVDDNVEFYYELIRGQRLNAKDESIHWIRSPFNIPFGGDKTGFVDLFISSNGTISFSDRSAPTYSNSPLPKTTMTSLIAPYWDDLVPAKAESDIYVKDIGQAPERQLIVEWWNFKHYRSSGTGTFQVIFYENSPDIRFNYLDADFTEQSYSFGRSATVGVQSSKDVYTQYSFNAPALPSQKSVIFRLK